MHALPSRLLPALAVTPLAATAFRAASTVDAAGAVATLPDGRWVNVPLTP